MKAEGIYQHYKGTKVKVLGEAVHSETLEPMIVYIHLEDGMQWVRPKQMFFEKVKVDGKKVPRFKKIEGTVIITPSENTNSGQ